MELEQGTLELGGVTLCRFYVTTMTRRYAIWAEHASEAITEAQRNYGVTSRDRPRVTSAPAAGTDVPYGPWPPVHVDPDQEEA